MKFWQSYCKDNTVQFFASHGIYLTTTRSVLPCFMFTVYVVCTYMCLRKTVNKAKQSKVVMTRAQELASVHIQSNGILN